MKITKGYNHLYQANIPATEASVENTATPAPTPTPAAPPTFAQLDSSSNLPPDETKQSIIPKLVVIGLIALIIFLVYKLIPRSYEDCSSLPGSKVNGDTCTTFFRRSFTKGVVGNQTAPSPADTTGTSDSSYPFPSTTPKTSTDSAYIPTTKGGAPLTTLAPTKTSTKPAVAKPTATPQNPVPTSAPNSDTAVPSDWVKHRYPDQKIAFWLPKGWTGSTAVYHTDTGITNLTLGGPDSIKVAIMPNWNSTNGANNQATNYQVKDGLPAIKIVGDAYTTVYFERSGQVYQFTCQNSLWSTCHITLQNLEFI